MVVSAVEIALALFGEEEEQIFIAKQMDDMGSGAPTPKKKKIVDFLVRVTV